LHTFAENLLIVPPAKAGNLIVLLNAIAIHDMIIKIGG
jgi:hypothetical protein